MSIIKKVLNNNTNLYEFTQPKSGRAFLNEKNRIKIKDSKKTRQPYIAINGNDIEFKKTENYSYQKTIRLDRLTNNSGGEFIKSGQKINLTPYNTNSIQNINYLYKNSYNIPPDYYTDFIVYLPTKYKDNTKILEGTTYKFTIFGESFEQLEYDFKGSIKIVYVIDYYNIVDFGTLSFKYGTAFNSIEVQWNGNNWIDLKNKNVNSCIFNDNKSIIFDKSIITNSPIKYYTNIATGLSTDLFGKDNINISEFIATPSILSDIYIEESSINQKEKINKYLKSDEIIKFEKNDSFLESNIDFSNLKRFEFLEDYEYTSINIDLDTPVDVLLQHTAVTQVNDIGDNNTDPLDQNDVYSFYNNQAVQYERLNTPFVLYNFESKTWEYRGIPKPIDQYSLIDANQNYSNILKSVIVPKSNNQILDKLPLIVNNQDGTYNKTAFQEYFEKYYLSQDPLTNTPINYLSLRDEQEYANDYKELSYLSAPTNQFGFPNVSRKFNLFDDNILKMSKYINKEFVLDRISLNLNVSLEGELEIDDDLLLDNGLNISLNYGILSRKNIKNTNTIGTNTIIYPFHKEQETNFDLNEIALNRSSFSNLFVPRIILKDEYSYQNILNNFDIMQGISNNEFITINNLVTFGNIIFNSSKNTLNSNIEKNIINNSDLFLKIPNVSSDSGRTAIDYNNNLNFTSIIKKIGTNTTTLNMHNLNYQYELPTSIDNSKSNAFSTRNGLNTLNGHDILNGLSYTRNINKDIFFKNNKKFINTDILYEPEDITFGSVSKQFVPNFSINNKDFYSPYVLMPNDEISFYFSISPTISPKLIKQLVKIKSGKVRFTLHGYLPKNNNKEKDWTNLKNLNQENINTTISGNNTFINDNYENAVYLSENFNTYNDRIFEGEFNNNDRKVKNGDNGSKILSGKSYIPYFKIIENSDLNSLYDDFKIFDDIKSNVTGASNAFTLNQNFIKSIIAITNFKLSKLLILGAIDENPKRLMDSIIFHQKTYGQFKDLIEGRKYMTYVDNRNRIRSIIDQRFINEVDGEEITDLTNIKLPLNKSKNLQLIDNIGEYYTVEQFVRLQHVAFSENVSWRS